MHLPTYRSCVNMNLKYQSLGHLLALSHAIIFSYLKQTFVSYAVQVFHPDKVCIYRNTDFT